MLKAITQLYGYKDKDLTLAGKLFRHHGCSERITDLLRSAGPQLAAVLLRDDDLLMDSGFGIDIYTRGTPILAAV